MRGGQGSRHVFNRTLRCPLVARVLLFLGLLAAAVAVSGSGAADEREREQAVAKPSRGIRHRNAMVHDSFRAVFVVRPKSVVHNLDEGVIERAQAEVEGDLERLELIARRGLERTGSSVVDIVVLPEMVFGHGAYGERSLPAMSSWAARLSSYVVFPYSESVANGATGQGGSKYNTAAVFDRTGKMVGKYRKQKVTKNEKDMGYLPGDEGIAVIDADWGSRFCVLTCQDIYFPELWSDAHRRGCDSIVWPSAFSGAGLLESYARLHGIFIFPAPQHPEPCQPLDMIGRPPDSESGLIRSVMGPGAELEDPTGPGGGDAHVLGWMMHINSRVVCASNEKFRSLYDRLRMSGQATAINLSSLFWSPCILLIGVSRSGKEGSGRPAFRVDDVLSAAGLPPRGLAGFMAKLWAEE